MSTLHAHRVRVELPRAANIGKDQQGRWRTTALKEYAPALCSSFAEALAGAIFSTPTDTSCLVPTAVESAQYQSMVINHYGQVVGADYHR